MLETGWTWQELQNTPAYVVEYTWDLLQIRREAARKRNR